MFVKNIPNGSTVYVQRGTGIHLLKLLLSKAKKNQETGELNVDYLRVNQLAEALGITPQEVHGLVNRCYNEDFSPEEVIQQYFEESKANRDKTLEYINSKLAEINAE